MAYDFPSGPAVGQSFPTGDKTYVWNGYAWSLDPIPGLPSSSEYVLKVGDTMTGHLTLNADPVNPLHAATKQYVDTLLLPLMGGNPGEALVKGPATPAFGNPIDSGNF